MENKNNIIRLCANCSEERLKEFQKTFDKDEVKIGDFVKKAFKDNEAFEDDGEVEHLWVEVKEICKDGFNGYVDNEVVLIKNVKYQDYVKVKFEEVEELLK